MHAVLESIARHIAGELSGLDPEAVQAHPGDNPQRWSRRQIVEHLALTSSFTTQLLEERLRKGRVCHNQHRTRLQSILQMMVLGFGYLPSGTPALEATMPGGTGYQKMAPKMDGEDLANLLIREMRSMDSALHACRSKFGMERVAVHPILGPLRIDQWLRYHSVHGRHHLKQMVQIRNEQTAEAIAGQPANIRLVKELQIPAQRSLT